MQGGLTAICAPFLRAKGWTGNPNSFVTWWRRTHYEELDDRCPAHREHTPYREIGHRAVAHVMDRAGISYTRDEVRIIWSRIEKLKPFPEVPRRSRKIKTRYALVVLSNGDPDRLGRRNSITRFLRPGHLGRRSKLVQAACRDLHQGGRAVRREARPDPVVANHAFDCIGAKSKPACALAFIDRRSRPFGETPHQPMDSRANHERPRRCDR